MTEQPFILSVDDNLTNQEIMQELLQLDGYQVKLALNGQEALELLTRQPLPGIILMDLLMPVMDGVEATRHIRRNPSTMDIPIIAISASINDETVSDALEAGCNDFISKPINRVDLLNKIKVLIKN